MNVTSRSNMTLEELRERLEQAVDAGDREVATELYREILGRVADQTSEWMALERSLRDAMARLDRLEGVSLLDLELGHSSGSGDGVVFPVWYGTNRKPLSVGDRPFTSERHDCIGRGRVEVYIPHARRDGETGSSFWTRLRRFDLRDDRIRIQQIEPLERAAFLAEINEEMRDVELEGETSHALVFLHGYNVSFEEAAIRAAQLGFDLKVTGATVFFSWPSKNSVTAYTADESTIEASESAITTFLLDFAEGCGAEKVHVIAHSMGNRGLLRALQRIAVNAETRGRIRFGQIFLAAPDIDRDLFLDLASLYPQHCERATLYASDGDRAVHASAKIHGAPRAGYFTPYTVAEGVDTVAVPDFDIDLLGHSYFSQSEALLSDMYDLIRRNSDPGERRRITEFDHEGRTVFALRR